MQNVVAAAASPLDRSALETMPGASEAIVREKAGPAHERASGSMAVAVSG